MRAGTLRHKIIFQKKANIKDATGQAKETWQNEFTTKASIQTISGKEEFLSNQNFQTMTHKLRVRYSKLINSKQRILFGNRVFEIISAPMNIFEKNKELEILVKEIV